MVRGLELADETLLVAGHAHEDLLRLVGEIEGAGDDVAVRGNDDTGSGPDALADLPAASGRTYRNHIGAAGGLDLHDPRPRRLDSRLDGLLLKLVQVGGADAGSAQERDQGAQGKQANRSCEFHQYPHAVVRWRR